MTNRRRITNDPTLAVPGEVIRNYFVIRHWSFVISQQVTHLYPLGFQVAGVVRVWLTLDRHLFDHLDAVTFEADHLLRVVGEETKLAHAEIVEDLRADAVIAQVARKTKFGICFHRIEPL